MYSLHTLPGTQQPSRQEFKVVKFIRGWFFRCLQCVLLAPSSQVRGLRAAPPYFKFPCPSLTVYLISSPVPQPFFLPATISTEHLGLECEELTFLWIYFIRFFSKFCFEFSSSAVSSLFLLVHSVS